MSKQWEYNVEDISWVAESRKGRHLNFRGAEGWELVSVDNGIAYMKREKKAEPQEHAFPTLNDPWAARAVELTLGKMAQRGLGLVQ